MAPLVDKAIIVTGAGGGIGRAASLLLAEAGAKVVVSDIAEDAGRKTVEEIHRAGGLANFIPADLSVESDVSALIRKTVALHGRLDGAFNNAGLEQCSRPLHALSTEQWERAIRVDLTSVFWCLKYQIIAMLETDGGAIVNTASALGQVGTANASEYVAAKHGVVGLTRAAAAEYGARNIRINAVLPGIIETPMFLRLSSDPALGGFFEKLRDRHSIGRFGTPAEVGEAVKWLLSGDASFMNGAAVSVDGGYLSI